MALLILIFLILHFGVGLMMPYRPAVKPYYYRLMHDAGLDLDRRLNRAERPQSVRIVRGAAVGLLTGGLAAALGEALYYAGRTPYGLLLQLIFLACCVNFMMPVKVVRQVLADIGDLPRAKAVLQPYFEEPLEHVDGHTVIRKTITFMALSFNKFLLAPVFWLLAAGPVGMALCVTYAALRDAFGLPDKRRKYFGQFVRGADILMNIIPAAIGAFFIMVGGIFVRRVNPWNDMILALKQCARAGLAYQDWLVIAMASGLGVRWEPQT